MPPKFARGIRKVQTCAYDSGIDSDNFDDDKYDIEYLRQLKPICWNCGCTGHISQMCPALNQTKKPTASKQVQNQQPEKQ